MALGAHLLHPSSVNALFHGHSKLQLHGKEKSRNRRQSNDGDRTGDPPAQKAARQPTELRLLLIEVLNRMSEKFSRRKLMQADKSR